ncbi:DMT family transporter [Alicyclobacillus fastidiosus]|uniref:DMT family transporter n=1 Tax=Alicyclobacillus fastidiosus TaxID=392011 RepID=A0ABY6ZI19_9BACL|nr:DMT family transporter [Alicyclobacillus fastidiosus]WAH42555.1 DMT family transporter [Alicyclobacillus fastidiosus]GMA64405.1 putative transporter YvbV [Alicyclobacillus fastidiosus]
MEGMSRTRTVLLISFLVVMWGVNWPLTKIALVYTPPILFAGIRTVLGGLLLLIVAIPRFKLLRFKQTWHIYLISCLFNIVLYYGLQTVGLKYLPAGLFSVIVFLQPVLLGVLSWAWLGESMYGLKIVGLILGFAGVAVISAGSLSGHLSVVGVILALCSAVAWALGTAYVKKTSGRVDSIWLVTVQLIIGGLVMTGLGTGLESWSSIVWNVPFIATLIFISVFVIAAGWLVFFILIGSGEASKVASYTFLIPLISIVTGTVFLHEPFTLYLLAGLVLIVVSIYFVNRPRKISTPPNSCVESVR